MANLLLIFGWLLLAYGALWVAMRVRRIDQSRKRLFASGDGIQMPLAADSDEPLLLGRWLFLAGTSRRLSGTSPITATAMTAGLWRSATRSPPEQAATKRWMSITVFRVPAAATAAPSPALRE
ncbi:MAG TPA: hypothetical protein VG326_09775 [Tepidisphaeraceae bacterium]|jgi:hypothetical protein|nr:hypothetical protein [Tepidisphaeraceae bacterium]